MTTDTDKLVEMALADAYEKGWCAAAQWANRDDLRHDTDSIAYAGQRDAILVGKAGKLIASLCGDVEPVAFMYPSDLAEFERKEMVAEAVSVSCTSVVTHERTVPLYSASTVAALKARVAELEKDAARLEFVCNSPNRMVERESGLWRVYEDVAPADHPTAVWQGITPRWHVTPREAIDAAITAALTKGQP